MFQFLKKSNPNYIITAPVSGRCIALEDINDDVFSTKMLGDGVAIDAKEDTVCAPADGIITTIVVSKHAFGIKLDNGLELLVHIGLETVSLEGEGFTVLAKVNDRVKQGTPIIKVDRSFIESKGMSLITPVIILGEEQCEINKSAIGQDVVGAKSSIMEYKLK